MPEDSHQLDSRERRSFWENHIEQWRISGLSQAAYCRKHRLKAHRFIIGGDGCRFTRRGLFFAGGAFFILI